MTTFASNLLSSVGNESIIMSIVCDPELGAREYRAIQKLIFDLAGISLSDNKQIMVKGRLAKRLRKLELESYADYVSFLSSSRAGDEVTNFINALTTNKTSFFREQHHFDYLKNKAFPQIVEQARDGRPKKLRIWCSASSTGEEPYSIAMTAMDFFGRLPEWDVKILASDIDTNVLQTAENGVYGKDYTDGIPKDMLHRFFDRSGDRNDPTWQARPELKELIAFRKINLMDRDWPINTAFDIIFCRNVMIYFNSDTQKVLIQRFADKMQPGGHLIIGHSESLFGISDMFKPIGDTVYLKNGNPPTAQQPTRTSLPDAKPLNSGVVSSRTATRVAFASGHGSTESQQRPPGLKQPTNTVASINQALGNIPRHPIIVGEVHASGEPVWVSTLLGSCLAVCMYDEEARIGGMNHFLIPTTSHSSSQASSLGIHAMELLINQIMKLGGDRRRLKTKLFGGAAVVKNSNTRWNIGEKNIAFAREFLATEGIPVVSSHTGGTQGMHVYFNTHTAKVYVRLLDKSTSISVQEEQTNQSKTVAETYSKPADVTLF